MKTSSTFQHIVLALSSCAACSIFSSQGRADDALISPPKGFQPALTYQVGDFESINVAYGSISLRFPTATLAPGAAGMRSGFSLFYNSSYFDTRPMPTPSGIVSALTLSKGGGWSHSTTFSPEIVRTDGDCFGNPPQNQGFQMYVVDPDGARHLMVKKLAAGEVAFGVADCAFANYDEPRIYNTAYWDYTQGAGLPYSQTWFSVDGTHMRLAIQSANPAVAGNGYSDYPTRDAWTIYMADGSRVEQTLSDLSSVTTFDKNGNWVKYTKTTVGLQPVETMKDVNLRTVKYTTSSSACGCDEIRQVVTASESTSDLIWRVYWNGSTPNAWTGYLSSTRPQDQGALVYPGLVSKIEFPARSSPDGTSFTPTYSFVYGSTLGQLTSVTLPTSGTVAYAWQSGTPYNLNGLNYPYYYQVLGSRLTTKTVTHDGTSDGWTYTYPNSTGNSWSQVAVKTPSNRTTTYGLAAPIDFRYSMSGYSGRVSTTQEPNGDVRAVSWGEKAPSLPVPYSNSNMPLINPYVSEEYGIFAEGGGAVMEKLRSTDVDVNGIPTSEIEYDWIPYSTATPYPGRGSFTTLRKRVTTPKTTAGRPGHRSMTTESPGSGVSYGEAESTSFRN